MIELPRILAPWAEDLDVFPDDVARTLGHWLPRVDTAVGPLRSKPLADGDPDGFDGLTRRGSYQRLLATEWLLAEVAPDEFIRRAASGEHAFLRIGQRSPASASRSVVLLDAGWQQVGAPRLAHMALLVVLARRARAAAVPFYWGVIQTPGDVHEGVSRPGIHALLASRTPLSSTAQQLDAWWQHLAPEPDDDLWLVGGPELIELARRRRLSHVLVGEAAQPGPRQLELEVRDRGHARHKAVLELPTDASAVRALRHPFADVARSNDARTPGLAQNTSLLVLPGSRRIVGRSDEGELVAAHIPNSRLERPGRTRRARVSSEERLLGVGYLKKNLVVATRRGDDIALYTRGGDLDYPRTLYTRPRSGPAFVDRATSDRLHPLCSLGGVGHDTIFGIVDAEGNLFALPPSRDYKSPYELRLGGVVALRHGGMPQALVRHGTAQLDIRDMHSDPVQGPNREASVFGQAGWRKNARFGAPRFGEAPFLVALDYGKYWVVANGHTKQRVAAPAAFVAGVWHHPERGMGLVVLDGAALSLYHVSATGREPLTWLQVPAAAAAMAADVVAWLGTDGLLNAWSLRRSEELLTKPTERPL